MRMNSESEKERGRGREKETEDEVANCLHVTRFIMLAPIARNTLRSFHGVIHRGVITNAYCGSAEARASGRARAAARKFRGARAISFRGISPPPPPPLVPPSPSVALSLSLSSLVSISILSPSSLLVAPANNYNDRSVCVIVGGTLMRSFRRTLCESTSVDKKK